MRFCRTYRMTCLIIAALLCSLSVDAQTESSGEGFAALKWGIKAGLNAPIAIDFETYSNGEQTEGSTSINKVGYTFSAFARINLDEFFFQPELSWNIGKQQLSFITPVEGSETGFTNNLFLKYYSGNIGMLAGYNLIHNGPYVFSAMIGASFRYNYKTDFDFGTQADFSTNKPDYNYLGVAAVSFVINKVFFEFRYEFNFPNSNIYFDRIPEASEQLQSIALHKRENILSFSCGLIF